ncbi:Uncharacterised protein [Mycobacteroides abscessus subsp. abscessus]|nr:Uncharacterised protein [Mycobacteroides abscessus subsp. abscessus]
MGLADAVAAVEVDALGTVLALGEELSEEPLRPVVGDELLELGSRFGLRGLVGVGPVARERHVLELRGRDESGDEFVGGDGGIALAQRGEGLLGIHPP